MLVLGLIGAGCSAQHAADPSRAAATPTGSASATASPGAPTPKTEFSIRSTGYRLTAPIQRSVAVRSGGLVYIAGGLDASGVTVDGVFSMDPSTGHLTSLGSLPHGAHDAAGAVIGGKLYVFAGGAGSGTNDVQAFDLTTEHGAVVSHLPVALSDLAAATVGDTTYLVGGYDGTKPRTEIYATADGMTFRTVGHLPTGLRYPALTVADGRLVMAGGQGPDGPTDGILQFDPADGSVRSIGHLPTPIAHASAVTLGNEVFVIGGRDANDQALEAVTAIDLGSGKVDAMSPLAHPVADAATAAGPGETLLIGGFGIATLDQVLEASLRSVPPRQQNVYAAIRSTRLSPTVTNDPTYIYVPNGIPGTVEVIDPATFRIVRTIHLGALSYPEHVTPSWNLRWLYVDTSSASELAVIDPRTGKLVRVIHNVEHPYNLYFTLDGSVAIDVAEYYDRLDFMDPHTWKLIKSVPMPCNGPDHLDFSADGSYLVIGCEFDGTVVKVDVAHMRVVGTVDVGGLPVDVKLSPNGKVFYVANQGTGGVSIVDPVSMRVVKFISTGNGAHGMAISRDTKQLYLTNRIAGTISVIDFSTRSVVHTWTVGGSPDMVQVSPDGSQLWVSNRYGTTIDVISTVNGHVIKRIEVGPDPHGLAYFPQPGRFSLGHNGVYR
ncbi:MAG: Kelch repeat-containing protein [Actinomycetota bacterium]